MIIRRSAARPQSHRAIEDEEQTDYHRERQEQGRLAAGDSWLDPAVTARVLATYRSTSTTTRPNAIGELTARERDVLAAIGTGLSNTEIAGALSISELTVKSHIGRIFAKLGLRDRAAAIVYAFDHGIVTPNAAP